MHASDVNIILYEPATIPCINHWPEQKQCIWSVYVLATPEADGQPKLKTRERESQTPAMAVKINLKKGVGRGQTYGLRMIASPAL